MQIVEGMGVFDSMATLLAHSEFVGVVVTGERRLVGARGDKCFYLPPSFRLYKNK